MLVTVEDGKVVFSVRERKPDGIPDNDWKREVALIDLGRLSDLPKNQPWDFDSAQIIWIPQKQRWVILLYGSHQERGAGPNEEDIYGPFLSPPFGPPSAIDPGNRNDVVVSLTVMPYVDGKLAWPRATCPKCRKPAVCTHHGPVPNQGENRYDLYSIECSSCGFKGTTEEYAGKESCCSGEPYSICPYCNICNK